MLFRSQELGITVAETDYHDVDTIGGLMAKKLGRVPIPGSTISLEGWSITAERPLGRRRRISSVLVIREVSLALDAESDEISAL